ncbi:hypothetical protein GCM10017771_77090 [Streptomyces capitiformicae]|uniref:Uncharacterized protein n=1 Tax=Streptomyces capitiformicae TaxID=2014920 RepID=A0A918ZIB2_9ACTN|nr:hypothetical protein GCM10017771_77090 [Streptomyces capitiformicae]
MSPKRRSASTPLSSRRPGIRPRTTQRRPPAGRIHENEGPHRHEHRDEPPSRPANSRRRSGRRLSLTAVGRLRGSASGTGKGGTGSKKGLAAALPVEGPRTVGKPDVASARLPNGAVTEPGYLTLPTHLKGKYPS